MKESQQPALCLFVIGLLGLGVIALIVGDFALVWQPVPARVPARHVIAYATGALMLLLGVGLLIPLTRVWAARVLLVYLFVWALLKVPGVIAAPTMEATWLGLGELTLLLSGGWTLLGKLEGGRERAVRIARILFAVSVIPIGLSHIVYPTETAGFVPHWLPYRTGWAYLTGAGQIASGLGVLFNVLPRMAAWAEAIQITLYTLLVWAPAIVAAPKARLPWTAFFISWIIGAAAWAVAQNIPLKVSTSKN